MARLLPPTYLCIALVLIAILHLVIPGVRLVGFPWGLLGLLPITGGIVMNILADQTLHHHQTTVKPLEATSALVTTGIYGVTRHPMYLGFILILFGVVIGLGSLSPWSILIGFGIVIHYRFVIPEERKLESTFGDVWRMYAARVRRCV